MKKSILVVMVLFAFSFARAARAADFSEALSIISANAPAGADVASMGNAWVALPDFSTNNPAVDAASEELEKANASMTGTYYMLRFKHGPDVSLYDISPVVKLPVGVMRLSFTYANSGTAGTKTGMDMKYDSFSSFRIGYGLKVAEGIFGDNDKLFLGVNATPYSKSVLKFSVDDQRAARFESRSYDFGAGLLYQLTKGVNIGAYYNYGRSSDKDRDYIGEEIVKSKSSSQLLRVGASWQILPMTLIAADWQYVNLDGYCKSQLFAGIEQGIIKDFLYLYGGWAANGPTAGIGMYFEKGGINIGYMSDPFKEADKYLGKSQLISAAIYWTF